MSDLTITPAHADVLRILADRHGLDADDALPSLSLAEIIGRSQVREARVTRSNVMALIDDLVTASSIELDHGRNSELNRHVMVLPKHYKLTAAGRLALSEYDARGRGRCAPGVYYTFLVLQFALWSFAFTWVLLGNFHTSLSIALVLQQVVLFLALESGKPR